MTTPGRFGLAVVAIAKNEATYIEEWIAYHCVVGVEHFFVYDNNSDDDIRGVLRRFVNHGLVTLIDFPMGGGQVPAYRHALHCFGAATTWLAAIDLDEFIVPKLDADIPSMLARLGAVERVVMPWRNFGFSGHRTRPPGLVIESYRRAENVPAGGFAMVSCKSIARSSAITSMGVHTQSVAADHTVDADGGRPEMVDVRIVRPSFAAAQVNHYVTKSEEEFVAKVARGEANRALPRTIYTVDDERGYDTIETAIDRFVEPTRLRLDELRALSPTPFRYGSQTRLRVPPSNPFVQHATLAVSNYLHGMGRVRNGTKPIENLADDGSGRAYVARADGHDRGLARGPLSGSPHLADMVRRLEATVRWRADEDGVSSSQVTGGSAVVTDDGVWLSPVPGGGPGLGIAVPVGCADERLHLAAVVVVDVDTPVRTSWRTRGAADGDHVGFTLPGRGRFACVVEANGELAHCAALVVEFDTDDPVRLHTLVVVSYG